MIRRVSKAIGALLGGVSAPVLVGLFGAIGVQSIAGVNLTPDVVAGLAIVLATIGTWLAPANAPKARPVNHLTPQRRGF